MNINGSYSSIQATLQSLKNSRTNDFEKFWDTVTSAASQLELPEPEIPRLRKAPKRYETNSSPHSYSSPQEYYRRIFYEVLDTAITAVEERFPSETMDFLKKVENFLVKKEETSTADDAVVQEILALYKDDKFEKDRLILHRDMMIDQMKIHNAKKPENLSEVVQFLRGNLNSAAFIAEIFKLVRIVLTIPISTAVCERSFSMLRLLKTYLRSTLKAERLNHISILHAHQEIAATLDLNPLMNEWISRASVRASTFALALR